MRAIFLMMTFMALQNSFAMDNKIFSDDFSDPAAAKWNDMSGWGFGVWQVDDGMLVSFDSTNPAKQLYAALPKFENAVLAQDYRALFRFKPISGGTLQFTVNVRQQGLDAHKVEIGGDGAISIVKAESGKLPRTLEKSVPGAMQLDVWQWFRLDVIESSPLSIKVKIWQGDLSDEPEFYHAIAVDDSPLSFTNINFALVTMQTGGSYVAVDSFDIFRNIPGSDFWKWIDTSENWNDEASKKMEQAKGYYDLGDFWNSLKILEMIDGSGDSALLNNQALVLAEQNDFNRALALMQQAVELSADDPQIQFNSKWIWYASQNGGLLKPDSDSIGSVFIKPNKNVFKDNENIELFISVLRVQKPWDRAIIYIIDEEDKQVITRELNFADSRKFFVESSIVLNSSVLDDGNYLVRARIKSDDGQEAVAETTFEVIRKSYQKYIQQFDDLQSDIERLRFDWQGSARIFDLANVEAELAAVELAFADCDAPGLLDVYRSKIEEGLEFAGNHLEQLKKDKRPFHHQQGSYMRGYVSEIDSSLQGYAVFCPDEYQPEQPYPLVINLHGYDPGFSRWQENPFLPVFMPHATAGGRYIVANPFGRGNTMYQHLGENDVLRVLAEVKRLYNIDENRIYLTGGSMGGGGTWNIGLNYPDLFAAIAPIMGPTEFSFWTGPKREPLTAQREFINAKYSPLSVAENALHLPVFCNHGAEDDIVPVEQSRKMFARFKELGYPIKYVEHEGVAHGGFDPQMEYEIYDWFEDKLRNPFPQRVIYKTADLKHNSAYWITIHEFVDLLQFAEIDARIVAQNEIEVRAKNIARFSIHLEKELFSVDQPLVVKLNGDSVQAKISSGQNDVTFLLLDNQRWTVESPANGSYLKKNSQLSGPMIEAFNSGFIVIYGTDGGEQMAEICRQEALDFSVQWEKWQHHPCRVKSDIEITENDIQKDNLILIGNADCNRIVSQINASLPIRFDGTSIRFAEEHFTAEHVGCSFIYPNPLNAERYVLIFAGNSPEAIFGITRRVGFEFDYLIFDNRTLGLDLPQGNLSIDGTPLRYGFFDQKWRFEPKYRFREDLKVRKKLKPRLLPILKPDDLSKSKIYLSDMKPDSKSQIIGHPQFDRTFWGEPFTQMPGKGIGVFPNSELTYKLDGKWDVFTADLSATLRPFIAISRSEYTHGKIQFGIFGDDRMLFASNVMDVNSDSQHIEVPVSGVKKLRLIVRTQDWLPYFAQGANWINARLERQK